MELLAVVAVLVLLGLLGLSIYVTMLSVSTMRMHRQAMHAFHQELAHRALERNQATQAAPTQTWGTQQ